MNSNLVQYVFFAVFAVVILWMLLRFVKFGGLRGAMFGAGIRSTVGQVKGVGGSMVGTALKVHVLGSPPDKAVGIELVAKSALSYQMLPITLSIAEAKELIGLLQTATGGR